MIETAASKSFVPQTVAEEARNAPLRVRSASPLVWLNLFCLDAPLVAITWQLLFAKSFGIAVANGGTVALFLTAWLIYLADRLGDNLSLRSGERMSLRQQFSLRRRGCWVAAISFVALADIGFVVTQLDRQAIVVGAVIGSCALLYLLINRFGPALWRVLPLKETSIGFIFAAGTMVGLLRSLTSAALPAWLLFAVLCSLNCIAIAVWERGLDAAQNRVSIATAFPRVRHLLLPALAIVCLTSAVLVLHSTTARALYLCLTSSALLLGAVHIRRDRLQPDLRTALADLVLLTPVIALLIR
ncbi:MAG: hypothetical protein ACJ8HU_08430 [Chthoniobacterales bacterium]